MDSSVVVFLTFFGGIGSVVSVLFLFFLFLFLSACNYGEVGLIEANVANCLGKLKLFGFRLSSGG